MRLLERANVAYRDRTADPMNWGLAFSGPFEWQTPIASVVEVSRSAPFDGEMLVVLSNTLLNDPEVPEVGGGYTDTYPEDAVQAIEYIKNTLGVSQLLALKAASIPERTFEGWKQEGRRPRISSLQYLWPLVNVVRSLAASHLNLAAWVASDEEAQRCLGSGDLNGFVIAESNWAARTYPWSPIPLPDDQLVEAIEPADEVAIEVEPLRMVAVRKVRWDPLSGRTSD